MVARRWAARSCSSSMVVGLVVSIFQAATQINEATLTFVPEAASSWPRSWSILGPGMVDQPRRLHPLRLLTRQCACGTG